MRKKILIIDPFSSASYLSNFFKLSNIEATALYTFNFNLISEYSKPKTQIFEKEIFINSLENNFILSKLKEKNNYYDYILNGAEESSNIFDFLTSNLLPLLSNDVASTEKRCNKNEMQKALKNFGIRHIKEILIPANVKKLELSDLANFQFPLFLKPTAGYGSINTQKINSFDELNLMLNNRLFKNCDYILQEFLEGTIYAANVFSLKGNHLIANIAKFEKNWINNVHLQRFQEIVYKKEIWDTLAK